MKHNNKHRRTTIRTIAEYVELSPTTVSLALRGDDSIPLETRNRVVAAAKELNYTFVPRKRKNDVKQIKRLVYVIKDYGDQPVFANPFYGQILNGAEQACRESDANLSFVVLPHDYPESFNLPAALMHDVDGIIMSSPYPRRMVDYVAKVSKCPIVLVDNTFPGSPYDTVMADDFGGGYLVTQHLLEKGHTQILTISGLALSLDIPPSFRERYRGYSVACEQAGVNPLPMVVVPEAIEVSPTARREPFQAWIASLLEQYPGTTGFFGTGDLFALMTHQSLQNLNYRIPEDFSVVGFDNYEMANVLNPPLTTIHSYKRGMGQVAVRRLLARIEGDDMPPLHTIVSTDLVVRGSTGRVRRD